MASRSIKITCPITKSIKISVFPVFSSVLPPSDENKVNLLSVSLRNIVCSAVQETSTSTATTETKDAAKKTPAKPKPAAKAPAKPLPQLIAEDVIPPLKSSLETENDISEIELSFQDNRLEGSFLKNEIPYSFWAFFLDGVLTGPKWFSSFIPPNVFLRLFRFLTGPKGFSLSSYGAEVSTIEPFLIDEKKITGKHIVFWVEKRLAAQGILPVWKE